MLGAVNHWRQSVNEKMKEFWKRCGCEKCIDKINYQIIKTNVQLRNIKVEETKNENVQLRNIKVEETKNENDRS